MRKNKSGIFLILVVITISLLFTFCACDIIEAETEEIIETYNPSESYSSLAAYYKVINISIPSEIDYFYYDNLYFVYPNYCWAYINAENRTISEIDSSYTIHYNEGHTGLQSGEILLSKWDYLGLYCSETDGFHIDAECAQRIENDVDCLEKYKFKYLLDYNCFMNYQEDDGIQMFGSHNSLTPAALFRYGLLDLNEIVYDDYTIRITHYDNKGPTKIYMLKVVGYYETPMDVYPGQGILRDSEQGKELLEYLSNEHRIYTWENFPEGFEK